MSTGVKRTIKAIAATAFSVAFLTFAVVNRETVHISLFPLPYSAAMPQFLFAILCFAAGILMGWTIIGLKLAKSQLLLKAEHKRVMALQNEISTLHNEKQHPVPASFISVM